MITADYNITITIDKTPIEVFNAINNVRGWWSEEIEGDTNKLGAEFDYHYQDVHRCKMKITEFVPGKKVVWEVTANYFSFTEDKNEWKGNKLIFEITEKSGKTELHFTQKGLVPQYECYDICRNAWDTYIGKSLYNLIMTGKGEPNGKDKPQTDDEQKLSGFTTTFFVDKSPHEVFNAINNVRGWWQGEITGNTSNEGDEFTYQMKDVHYSKQRIIEVIPDKKVVWLVTESALSFTKNKQEWNDTKIIFEIVEINNKTQVRFTHSGLVPEFECFDSCSNAWGMLIQDSLSSLITTGKGKDVFK
ncbi:SRPBCC family protein [Flavobacterium sp. 3HN19-14]|uniref:SRPBCC family protein n=1 Tax=Flavobacterium sp. 3HN19-14 TaxID=3448133 RepID=UPI003EE2925E